MFPIGKSFPVCVPEAFTVLIVVTLGKGREGYIEFVSARKLLLKLWTSPDLERGERGGGELNVSFPDGEVLAVPLPPAGSSGCLVVGDGSSHVGGEHEPPATLPVPDNIKVSDT